MIKQGFFLIFTILPREGYEETFAVPACPEETVRHAVAQAVEQGLAWLVSGPTSCCKERVPSAALDAAAVLHPPPEMLPPQALTEEALPSAWADGETNGVALVQALSHQQGAAVPWGLVRESIHTALASRWLETVGSDGLTQVAENYADAGQYRLRRPRSPTPAKPPAPPPAREAALDGAQIQDLAEQVPALLEAGAGHGLRFRVGVSLDADAPAAVQAKVDGLLAEVAPGLKSA